MAGRPRWKEEDKARVFVTLTANQGNVKRTARETNVPENTVRRWKNEWLLEEKALPSDELVERATSTFVEDATRVRDKALSVIEQKLPEAKVGELNAVVGTLTDKLNVLQGHATSRQEHTLALPSAEELAAVLGPAVSAAIEKAAIRQDEIVDAEFVEIRGQLPA